MAIRITARGQVARLLPAGQQELQVEWDHPITVAELLRKLGVDGQLATAVVNGQRAGAEHVLADEDTVLLFSPLVGGN